MMIRIRIGMDFVWMTGIGIAISLGGWIAVSLSYFIKKVEQDRTCGGCENKHECFAKKEIGFLHSDYLSEWMLLSFLKIRKKCPNITTCSTKQKILCFFLCFCIYLLPFWSEGMNTTAFLYGISAGALLFLSIVDWNTQYIPLEMSGVILICGLIRIFVDFSNWLEYVIGLFAVSGFLFLINKLSTPILKKQYAKEEIEIDSAIGDGDIKLMAATGLLLGWKLNFLALGIGCIAGSVIHIVLMKIKKGDRQFALGPYLSLGVYITMICGEQLVSWYMSMMGVKPL